MGRSQNRQLLLVIAAVSLVAHLDLGNAVPNRAAHARKKATDPECDEDSIGIMFHWGYKPESHQVVTEDGYILTMHRLPYGKSGPSSTGGAPRPVIFLQHGLEGDSSNWITNLPWESAGFIFADAGFDVWMGNFRGNTYSRQHTSLDPKKDPFWAFSWDEHVKYDLPAQINSVLQVTGQSQLYYVGHSEGTMTAFAAFAENQELGSKIKAYFALAPIYHLGNAGGLVQYIAPFTDDLEAVFKLLGGYGEFLPGDDLIHTVGKIVCGFWITSSLCDDIIFLIGGADSQQLNSSRTPVYVSHSPAGTSTQNMVHFGQNVNSDLFQMYDFGSKKKNQEKYGQDTPPLYDVSKIKVPTYVYRGDLDILADPTDVRDIIQVLSAAGVLKQNVALSPFNHLDFIWGLNAAGEIYQPMVATIRELERQ